MADLFELPTASLAPLFAAWQADGRRILAPTDANGRTELAEVATPAQVAPDYLQTILSAKAVVLPKVERILSYKLHDQTVELQDAEPEVHPTVLFGLRPCEAKGFAALDAVFNWDCRDKFFNAHRDACVVVGLSCTRHDDACFCTSVGGGPGDATGSDLFLRPIPGGFLAEAATAKGRALQALAPALFRPAPQGQAQPEPALPAAFEHQALTAQLPALFESPLWTDQAMGCLGCGACAFVCPTCMCFDLQEEADARGGQRLRLWDACGFRSFTLHASGHNPRPTQAARWRQRVYHKFVTFPERYGLLGCVGCGKCTRACPVDMNLKTSLLEAAGARP